MLMDQLQTNLVPGEGQRAVIERRVPGQRPRAICSLATGRHRELLAETAPTLAAYAQAHSWSLVLSSERLGDRPPSWTKITLIQQLLQDYEFVLWVDADAVVVDLERDILEEIDEQADIWFARHPQERNPEATVLNAGIFLARSAEFTTNLLDAMWANEKFIDHNWWENAALLDLLGYDLEPPFTKLRPSEWDSRIGELDLAWNSVPGYCESPRPAINHHARSDHDNFGLRLAAMSSDRRGAMAKFPAAFEHVRSPSSAGVDARPRRSHDFDGLQFGEQPTTDELLALIARLDEDNETQRLRLIQVFDQLEDSVTESVNVERKADALAAELASLRETHDAEVSRLREELAVVHNTKLFRFASPFRQLYGRLLRWRRG
jgi:hypothetical protein